MDTNFLILGIIQEEILKSLGEDNLPINKLPNIDLKEPLPQLKGDRFDLNFSKDVNGKHKIEILSNCFIPNKLYDFIITSDGLMRIGQGHFRLSDKSNDILGAGEIAINNNGIISYLNNESGHYKPSKDDTYQIYKLFKDMSLTSKYCVIDIKH